MIPCVLRAANQPRFLTYDLTNTSTTWIRSSTFSNLRPRRLWLAMTSRSGLAGRQGVRKPLVAPGSLKFHRMSDQSKFDFSVDVSALSDELRLRFYETLAHSLTITVRVVWDDSNRSDAEKVRAIRCINEILHHVTSKIAVTRRHLYEWTESDMWGEIRRWVEEDNSISGDVGWAIQRSFEIANSNGRPT